MIIQNGLIYTSQNTFEPATVTTTADTITAVNLFQTHSGKHVKPEDAFYDASGCYVLPGLTDIHFHGCNGYDFCEGTSEAFEAIAAFEFSRGVTSICPATMSLPPEQLSEICAAAACYRDRQEKFLTEKAVADLVGIHLEGPFINPAKKGAQKADFILSPQTSLLREWQEAANGLIRLVSLAPEQPGACDCIAECRDSFHFSLAHTQADYETAIKAFQAGADHITHLYNAMSPFSHRAPGVIGAAFDTPACFAELICDGVHCTPCAVRAAFRLFGDDRIVLISDSMEAAGMPDGDYTLGGQKVQVTGNHAMLTDGTIAGSVTPLYECMLTAVSMGIPLASAVRAATINPCRSIGIDSLYGSIEIGKKAHFLVLNQSDLSIQAVIKGQSCFRA